MHRLNVLSKNTRRVLWTGRSEPLLQPLIDKICAEKQVIEQESFLF